MKEEFRRKFTRKFLWTILSLLITIFVLGSFSYLYLDSQLPDVKQLKSLQLPIPMRVFTSDGQLIAEFGEISRTPLPLDQVPPLLIKAILATEDQRFYEHSGVDFWGIMRAILTDFLAGGSRLEGASTITMQVARNFYLSPQQTFIRKITEILLALKIERELNKQEILELYLNKIYLGNRAYGVAAAAQVYYGKTLNQLTLPEMATIAGLPKAPSSINPLVNPIAAKDRRNHVLERMHDLGEINDADYQTAIKAPIVTTYHGPRIVVHAPYVAEMVRDMMLTSFGDDAYKKGYDVYTTINSADQIMANDSLRRALIAYDHRHGYRGVEKNYGKPDSDDENLDWVNILQKIPTVNEMQPALVYSVADKSITAMLSTGDIVTIPWSGLSWAKPAEKDGAVGKAPEHASDIVKIGDLIRVDKQGDTWQLAQIPAVEGAFVALNPQSGGIDALVGGFDFVRSKFNRVTQAQRQPGSGFKPFVYAAALAKGYTLATIINDTEISFRIPGQTDLWEPQNDDGVYHGPTRLRVALAKSFNVASVRLLQFIGAGYTINYATRFGFEARKLPRNLSLALGTASVTPLQMARGYAVFANGGYRVTPYLIDHISDNRGQVVYQAIPKIACTTCDDTTPETTPGNYAPHVIPTQIAFMITSALKDVINYGTGRAAQALGRQDIAGKTGTTSDFVDTWFTGFNSDIVASAWVGFDNPSSLNEFGAQAALPMWIDFMRTALAGKPPHTLAQPSSVMSAYIDPDTGSPVPDGTPGALLEYFRADNPPQVQNPPADSAADTDADADGDAGASASTPTATPPASTSNNSSNDSSSNGDPLF